LSVLKKFWSYVLSQAEVTELMEKEDVEAKAAEVVEVDSEKEVEASASAESMDVEIVGVTAGEISKKADLVTVEEESSEKDKKRDSEESGEYIV